MAGVFASMAVKWALDKLASFLPAAASSSSGTVTTASDEDVELLRKLERTMLRIQATLHDAEEHWNIHEESAKLRLKEFKELAYAAEDVVEEYENEVDRYELEVTAAGVGKGKRKRKRKRQEEKETYSNGAGMVPVPEELVNEAKRIIARIDEIKKYHDNFTLSEIDGDKMFTPDINTLRKTSSLVYEKSIIGREEDKNKIVEKLISIQGNNVACRVHVMAIFGMGGLGKTTLAQLVYNDPMVRQCFDVFAWVCVSEQFDVHTITKNIISAIKYSKKGEKGKEDSKKGEKGKEDSKKDKSVPFAELQEKLVSEVHDKRVLLVLDDVWNEDSILWEKLCAPMSETEICSVIVTTRNEAVASLVQTMPVDPINCLSTEESWLLFKQGSLVVHQDNDTPRNLVEIGKTIVEKCKGLPLAIKALGSILRCETDKTKWTDVLENKLWYLEKSGSGVLPALELSYKYMPIYLKRCFIALSLFPKDYKLSKSFVVKLWKSLDLLQSDKNRKEDDNGGIYFNELVQRSLLEVYSEYNDTYVMHDLIHDLACSRGAEEFFRIEGDTSKKIPLTVRYISTTERGALVKNLTVLHSIRGIIFLDRYKMEVELPLNCKKLRVVTHCLDEEFSLDGKYDGYSMYFPHGIGCAINLHILSAMEISGCGCFCNISELGSLNKIRELSVYGLGSVADIEDAKGAQLQRKKYLRSLTLDFDKSTRHVSHFHDCEVIPHEQLPESLQLLHALIKLEIKCYESQDFVGKIGPCDDCEDTLQGKPAVTVSHKQLLESLRPHHVLRKLEINHYKPQEYEYPSWLGNASYSNLTEIVLDGSNCQRLPTLGELPSLKSLKVRNMDQVEKIGREFCSHIPDVKGFPSLTDLTFNSLPKLSEWSEVNVGEFPCLETLSIRYAEKLGSLPPALFMSLDTLRLENCGNLLAVPASATLRKLVIWKCESLHQLPTLVALRELCISECESLHQLPTLVSLWKLDISRCESLQQLPTLVSLQELGIERCPSLHQLPTLVSLWKLVILCCGSLQQLPTLVALRELGISECESLHQLPTLVSLWKLHISGCESLQQLPTLVALQELLIWECKSLHQLPTLVSLWKLHISGCESLQQLPTLVALRELCIWECKSLHQLPTLVSLWKLDISRCESLQQLPTLVALRELDISGCESLQQLPTLVALQELRISQCKSLHQLPTLVSLWKLDISGCESLQQLSTLEALRELRIDWCPKLSVVGSLPSLTTLYIWDTRYPFDNKEILFDNKEILYKLLNRHPSLEFISVLCLRTTCIPLQPQSLPSLTKLHLCCPKLQYCDGLAGLTSLKELDVQGCPELPIFSNLHNVKIIRRP